MKKVNAFIMQMGALLLIGSWASSAFAESTIGQCSVVSYGAAQVSLTDETRSNCQRICVSYLPTRPNISCFWGGNSLNNYKAVPTSSIQLAPVAPCILSKTELTELGKFLPPSDSNDLLNLGIVTRGQCLGALNSLRNIFPFASWVGQKL